MNPLTPSHPSTQLTITDFLQSTTATNTTINMFSKTVLTLLLVTLIASSYAAELPAAGQVSSIDSSMKEMDGMFDQESQMERLASDHALDTEEELEPHMMSLDENEKKTMGGAEEKNVVRQRGGRGRCKRIVYIRCFSARGCCCKRSKGKKARCRGRCRRLASRKCR